MKQYKDFNELYNSNTKHQTPLFNELSDDTVDNINNILQTVANQIGQFQFSKREKNFVEKLKKLNAFISKKDVEEKDLEKIIYQCGLDRDTFEYEMYYSVKDLIDNMRNQLNELWDYIE